MSYSENAIMAKVRAMYGKRLTPHDYSQLISKKSVGEVASYLKKETYYAQNLAEVKEDLIHRNQLENLVRRRTLNTYVRLMKYAPGKTLFMTMYLMQNEIEQIITAIRLLNSGSMDRYIVTLPVHLARLMSFDLFALAKVKTFDDLLAVVERSDYYKIIGPFRPSVHTSPVNITGCEAALLTHYYQKCLDIARRDYRGETRDDLEKLLYHQIAIHNVQVIYRCRRYLNLAGQQIKDRMVPLYGPAGSKVYQPLLDAPDLHSMMDRLAGLRSLRQFGFDWQTSSTDQVTRMLAVRRDVNRKLFRFSTQPAIAVITYMVLLQIEESNIINIIEGIRYEMPPAQLQALLVL